MNALREEGTKADLLRELERKMDECERLRAVAGEMLTNIEGGEGFPDAGDYNRWAGIVRGPISVKRDSTDGKRT